MRVSSTVALAVSEGARSGLPTWLDFYRSLPEAEQSLEVATALERCWAEVLEVRGCSGTNPKGCKGLAHSGARWSGRGSLGKKAL